MKLVFAADLHGDLAHYETLGDLVKAERPAALLLGGDLFPGAGRKDGPPLGFVRGPFASFLTRIGIPTFAIVGNDDWPTAAEAMARLPDLHLLSPSPIRFGNHVLQGYPYVTPTPFRRQDFVRRDLTTDVVALVRGAYITQPIVQEVASDYLEGLASIEEELLSLVGGEAIWIAHCPPWGGSLDVVSDGSHVGSRALLNRIKDRQPLVTLHGHIHESPSVSGAWAERHGRTISVNPGRGDRLHAVVFNTEAVAETLRHTVYGSYR